MGIMTPRILIVDDDPDLLELLRFALAAEGFSVRTAATGPEALRKALRTPPDLVVLDLLLPGMNGFSVCEQLRLNPATAFIPVLMMTVLPGEFPHLVGVEAGANAYLNKPFRMEELVSCVRELLREQSGESALLGASPETPAGDAMSVFPPPPAAPETFLRSGSQA